MDKRAYFQKFASRIFYANVQNIKNSHSNHPVIFKNSHQKTVLFVKNSQIIFIFTL